MKKNYISPTITVQTVMPTTILAASGVTGGNGGPGSDIGNGGVDDGTHASDSRRRNGWDVEEDDEDF